MDRAVPRPDAKASPQLPSLVDHDVAHDRPPHFVVVDAMRSIPKRWRPRLRRLTIGSDEGAMYRWSYHDGSTWAAVLFEHTHRIPSAIVGWGVYTLQEAEHPIIGVYVDPARRGYGYGVTLVEHLLDHCGHLTPKGKIYAVADWWPKYIELIERRGFTHLEWD